MSPIGYFNAAVLGAIQGATEFLPISSSGHLALTERWLGIDPTTPEALLFNVLVHLGTLIAVAIVFAKPARRFATRLYRESRGSWSGRRTGWRILVLAGLATAPTAVIGLSLKSFFEEACDKPQWIGAGLLFTGVLLAMLARLGRGRRGWRDFKGWQAVAVGLAQSLAIMPGISRSGSTICVALFCGLRRRWAAEFSFLIAVPAILGATLLKIKDTISLPAAELSAVNWQPLLLGSVTSLIVGVAALRLLLGAVRRAKLHYFAVYCWLLGGVVLAAW